MLYLTTLLRKNLPLALTTMFLLLIPLPYLHKCLPPRSTCKYLKYVGPTAVRFQRCDAKPKFRFDLKFHLHSNSFGSSPSCPISFVILERSLGTHLEHIFLNDWLSFRNGQYLKLKKFHYCANREFAVLTNCYIDCSIQIICRVVTIVKMVGLNEIRHERLHGQHHLIIRTNTAL